MAAFSPREADANLIHKERKESPDGLGFFSPILKLNSGSAKHFFLIVFSWWLPTVTASVAALAAACGEFQSWDTVLPDSEKEHCRNQYFYLLFFKHPKTPQTHPPNI